MTDSAEHSDVRSTTNNQKITLSARDPSVVSSSSSADQHLAATATTSTPRAEDAEDVQMSSSPFPLTIIVAATARSAGIGRAGGLPWRLPGEMKYFARVTSRVIPMAGDRSAVAPGSTGADDASASPRSSTSVHNAVIMGRKTWASIPARFRPLKGRTNVVITRGGRDAVFPPTGPAPASDPDLGSGGGTSGGGDDTEAVQDVVIVASSLADAVSRLSDPASTRGSFAPEHGSRAFVIGGASVYDEALKRADCDAVLLTKVMADDEFECDTFFPVRLGDEPGRGGREEDGTEWEEASAEYLAAFTGEDFGPAFEGRTQTQGQVEWQYCLYRRKR